MRKPTFDPGLTQKFEGPLRRVINKDGSFNVHRRGASWRDFHPYLHLINLGWPSFLLALFAGYLVANTLFAAADLERLQAEVLILIKAYDDTFSQTVLARHSYRHNEIAWGRRFAPAFHVDGEGDLVLELRKVGELAS